MTLHLGGSSISLELLWQGPFGLLCLLGVEPEGDSLKGKHKEWFIGSFPHLLRTRKFDRAFTALGKDIRTCICLAELALAQRARQVGEGLRTFLGVLLKFWGSICQNRGSPSMDLLLSVSI